MPEITVKKLSEAEKEAMNISSWQIWTCDVSEFPWEYAEKESCYFLEGEVEVITDDKTVRIGAGDFVVFPRGIRCRWRVLKPVRKHYSFG